MIQRKSFIFALIDKLYAAPGKVLKTLPREPTLTFRFWVLSTFWVISGCTLSSIYYFKAFSIGSIGLIVLILSGWMGSLMAKHIPNQRISVFGFDCDLNPGPWNPKEHALILVAFWGSSYTAGGLGPLSAMELYYGKKMGTGWAILFLMTTQLLGYGFAGLYRDVLVRPPQIYYPGVLPIVSLLNAMHRDPSTTSNIMRFFWMIAVGAFVYGWFPSLVWPMLGSLPLLCWAGAGNWKAFLMGSGTYGFGLFDVSLDWNYISFFEPLYTPLWANANRFAGAAFVCWLVYPILYFVDTSGSQRFPAMSTDTWDESGDKYNISFILNPDSTLNHTALALYSAPYWSGSYAMHFFWGFAASTAIIVFAILQHGKLIFASLWSNRHLKRSDDSDPYVQLMAHAPRVPHSWYIALLVTCLAVAIAQLYGGEMQLPWWGLLLIAGISAVFTLPSGILFGIANMQISVENLSELIAGTLFAGKPMAVLTCMVYGRQILAQCLNMVSDLKFAFYMKIPERHVFYAQVYGTMLGPFVNYACMRLIIELQGPEMLTDNPAGAWAAPRTRNYYSLSVIWGILGPKTIFGTDSPYRWIILGLVVGPAFVFLWWALRKRLGPTRKYVGHINPVIILNGAASFPIFPTTNLMTSFLVALFFMGYVYRYFPEWWRKCNYVLGAGLDCGTQMVQLAVLLVINLPRITMPYWWGNDPVAVDRCFPPEGLPSKILT